MPPTINIPPTRPKWKAIIILALIMLLVGTGFYFFYQKNNNPKSQTQNQQTNSQATTTDETADWKTYTNTKYGFEFKYPSGLELYENDENPNGDYLYLVLSNFKYDSKKIYYTLPSVNSVMISYWVGKKFGDDYFDLGKANFDKQEKNFSVDNIPAIQTITKEGDPSDESGSVSKAEENAGVLFFKDDKEFGASVRPLEQLTLFNKILSTFKFISTSTTQSLPTSCVDQVPDEEKVISSLDELEKPVITSMSSYSGPVGMKLKINGCNLLGFEGDRNIWVENERGVKGIAYGEVESTDKTIEVFLTSPLCQQDESYRGLPCKTYLNLVPGKYKIYTIPWGNKSNVVEFTVTPK